MDIGERGRLAPRYAELFPISGGGELGGNIYAADSRSFFFSAISTQHGGDRVFPNSGT